MEEAIILHMHTTKRGRQVLLHPDQHSPLCKTNRCRIILIHNWEKVVVETIPDYFQHPEGMPHREIFHDEHRMRNR
jgi:hypothetical protein